ncbi:protein-disulfide reductase DsbD domain-containing protein [Thalassobellus sediminis]|uniref:protein-disulfide reductase DsbD domain-containing protein n=1 Tax=Thalassobellus sediminis TaxID=3367753 RepID=UPI0037B26B38
MKKIILVFALIAATILQAQILEPVKWSTSTKKISETEYELIAIATIETHWHLYSQTVPEGGPIATTFSFTGNGNYLKKGNTSEEEGHTIDDPVFGMKIKFFETKALFKQRIKLKTKEAFKVNATVEFMVCDDSRCLPPTEADLVFSIQ